VASIRASAGFSTVLWGSIGANNCSLIRRKPLTPQRSRNWFNIHTSGTAWRLDKWAKRRQSRCSASNRTKWLNAWTGVSTLKRLARYKLGRTELLASAAPTMARHHLVDEGVGDIRREQLQKLRGPGRGQFRIHDPAGYPKENVASRLFGTPSFFNDNQLTPNCLCRIP